MKEPVVRDILGPDGKLAGIMDSFEFRPQQLAMAEEIEAFYREGGVFLAEAGTGTGKTLAYLVPSILESHLIIVSTGTKNLQSQLVTRDLPLVEKITGRPLDVVLMKGRSNYLCMRKWNVLLRESAWSGEKERRAFRLIARWADTTKTGDRSEMADLPDASPVWKAAAARLETCLGKRCPFYDRCFVLKLKIRAQAADVLVVNHHLFFSDMALRFRDHSRILPSADAVVFDEAHLVEDIMTAVLGLRISPNRISNMLSAIQQWRPGRKGRKPGSWSLKEPLAALTQAAELFFGSFGKGEGRFALDDTFDSETERRLNRLSERIDGLRVSLKTAEGIPGEILGELEEQVEILKGDLNFITGMSERDYVYWGEHGMTGPVLHADPVDVSSLFREVLDRIDAPVVMTSATLRDSSGFDYVCRRLGLDDPHTATFESPFSFGVQGILYIPDHLPEPNENGFFQAAAEEIGWLLSATRGRALILCTSLAGMSAIREVIAGDLPYTLLIQGEASRERLLQRFKEDISSVLLATMSFWQGIDVPGEALSAVIIDKIPFAAPGDPVVGARLKHFKDQGIDAFKAYTLPRAIITLKQGVGRLIRSMRDRGVIAVLDNRLNTRGYGSVILRSLPAFKRVPHRKDVQAFFSENS